MKERYLAVEEPDFKADVDFLNRGTTVRLVMRASKLEIQVRVSHGEEASTFDLHDFEVNVPLEEP